LNNKKPAAVSRLALSFKNELNDYEFLRMVFKHLVQTFRLIAWFSNMTVVFWMLGFQCRLVRTLEWLTLWPNWSPLPQMSHFAMMSKSPFILRRRWPEAAL